MASSGGGRKKRLVSSLDSEVLERLSMKLNPRMLMKDYQTLGGRLKYTYEYIRNFDRKDNPTLALLYHWWSSKKGKEKTVTVLIEHLSEMDRDDAVDVLRPYEYYSSHEAAEYDENLESPVITVYNTDVNRNVGFSPIENENQQNAHKLGSYKPDMPVRPSTSQGVEYERNQGATFSGSLTGMQTIPDDKMMELRNGDRQRRMVYPNGAYADEPLPGGNTISYPMEGSFQHGMSPSTYRVQRQLFQQPPSQRFQNPSSPRFQNPPSPLGSNPSLIGHTSSLLGNLSTLGNPSSGGHISPPPFRPSTFGNPSFAGHISPLRQPNPRLPRDFIGLTRANMYNDEADGFYGIRENMLGPPRPTNLDGSSTSSAEFDNYYRMQYEPQRLYRIMDYGEPGRYNGQYGSDIDSRYIQTNIDPQASLATPGGNDITVATDKVALVIGNQDYAHPKLKGLQYPQQDAADVADVLTKLQFKVVSLINLTHSEMRTAMLAFCCLLGSGVYGVVYYAGHGYEDNGENYLLPVDSDLKYKRDESLRTQEILEAMQQCETSFNLLIVDACRVSLPNKSGITVPRVKRGVIGNTIFNYSCCSLQESLEEPNSRNGMYCSHLLRRLSENRRIEHILMDVATDFNSTYGLDQRPCMETDTVTEFRLTDVIQCDHSSQEFIQRCRRWKGASRLPAVFKLPTSDVHFTFEFYAPFCNVLRVTVTAIKTPPNRITELVLSLTCKDPLLCVEKEDCVDYENDDVLSIQEFEITNIQKLYKLQEPLILSTRALFKVNGKLLNYDKDVDLGYPLVSSVMCLWDNWLLGDQCKTTAV